MSHYLVTGGTGFIGFALSRALADRGDRVTLVDRCSRLEDADAKRFEVVLGDIADAALFDRLDRVGKPDAVLHLAAQTSARVSHEDPLQDFEINAKGTLLLLEWCRRRTINRIFYASSMAVYGDPKNLPVTEDTLPAPVSFYGVSKLAGEHYLRAFESLGVRHTTFRLFNVYGPGQDMENLKQGMASIYLAYVLKGNEVPVTGSLDRFRDFIYIDDVVSAWLAALDSEKSCGRVYNVGSGVKTTVRELLDVIIRECGHDPARYPVRQVEGHAGDPFGIWADSSFFQSEFGWRPHVSLSDGIRKMIAWCRSHEQLRT